MTSDAESDFAHEDDSEVIWSGAPKFFFYLYSTTGWRSAGRALFGKHPPDQQKHHDQVRGHSQ